MAPFWRVIGQGLFCARADVVALNLGHEGQHPGHDLGLHRVVEDDASLGDVQVHALLTLFYR